MERPFDFVVNALWEGRVKLDDALGLPITGKWLHRFRKSLFIRTKSAFETPSRVFCVGPYGDIKNYDGRNFYVSWYPAGLVATGTEIDPPMIPAMPGDEKIFVEIQNQIQRLAPDMAEVFANIDSFRIEGGWVFARGAGHLADAKATIHKRHQYGIFRHQTYFSVDTGKYSTAPEMAQILAELVVH